MSERKTRKKPASPAPVSVRLGEVLEGKLDQAVVKTGLSKSDLARLSIERGLGILLAQLESPVAEAA